jgi:hypothetical protein
MIKDLNMKNFKYLDLFNLLLFIFFSATFLQFVVDDQFITLRYAHNLIESGIWNWNADKNFVEGYTNFSYAVLAIIPHYFGISAYLFFKFIGYGLLAVFIIRARSLCTEPLSRFFVTLFLCANPYIYIHFLSGLETPLFMLLILEIFIQSGKIIDGEKPSGYFYFIALLLPLTRPEGVIFAASAMLVMLYKNKWRIPNHICFWLILVIGSIYAIWRYDYFGYLLPNTLHAKTEYFGIMGSVYNLLEARYYIVAILITALVIGNRKFTIATITTALVHLTAYVFTELAMNYAYRFFMQIYIPLFIYAVYFINQNNKKELSGYFCNKVTAYLTALLLIILPNFDYPILSNHITMGTRMYNSYKKVGDSLNKYKDKSYTLMVSDAGVIPYYADWKTYDSIGLVDIEIAHNKNNIEYMRKISPDVIFMQAKGMDLSSLRLNYHGFNIIYDYIKESEKYDFVTSLQLSSSYYMAIFVKKDLADYQNIRMDMIEDAKFASMVNFTENKNKGQIIKDILTLKYLNFSNPK